MQRGVRSEGRRLCITARSWAAYGERLQRLSVSSFVFLPSSIEWRQRQCHLAEDWGWQAHSLWQEPALGVAVMCYCSLRVSPRSFPWKILIEAAAFPRSSGPHT